MREILRIQCIEESGTERNREINGNSGVFVSAKISPENNVESSDAKNNAS